jgi:hypothetical protein
LGDRGCSIATVTRVCSPDRALACPLVDQRCSGNALGGKRNINMSVFRVHLGLASLALLALGGGPLAAQTPVPATLQVPLFPEFDLYGNQF